MLNQVILVGRVKEFTFEMLTLEIAQKEEDIRVPIELTEKMLNKVNDYLKKGDVIGVKGKLSHNGWVLAEKITFLSSRASKEEV